MTSSFFIKPVQGLTVRDPETMEPLKADGDSKPRTGYWLKRLRDGDVELAEQTKKKGK